DDSDSSLPRRVRDASPVRSPINGAGVTQRFTSPPLRSLSVACQAPLPLFSRTVRVSPPLSPLGLRLTRLSPPSRSRSSLHHCTGFSICSDSIPSL
ncbi:hypothetical protein PFISCL1PPCAC_11671, partial [Pristionchus fissidentatus]